MHDHEHPIHSKETSYVLYCLIRRWTAAGEPERFFLIEKQGHPAFPPTKFRPGEDLFHALVRPMETDLGLPPESYFPERELKAIPNAGESPRYPGLAKRWFLYPVTLSLTEAGWAALEKCAGVWWTLEEVLANCADPPETAPDRAPLNYLLQPRTQNLGDGRDYTRRKDGKDTPDWLEVQQVLWRIINAAFPAAALDHRFDLDWAQHIADVNDRQHPKRAIPQSARFQASATEQEIWCGALSAANAERHVLACFREIGNRDGFTPADVNDFFDLTESGQFDAASAARQSALKETIRQRLGDKAIVPIPFFRLKRENGKVIVYTSAEDIRKFCDSVENQLRPIIERQFAEYWNQTAQASTERAARELKIEQDEHERFGRERGGAKSFVGRENELKAISNYLKSDSPWPIVVHGASGCGKTALLARAAGEILMEDRRSKMAEVIVRFIGVTPRSSDIRSLLGSLCQELRLWHPREGELPADIKALGEELQEHFKSATPEQPLILFLDALDQLSDADNGRLLNWIPYGQLQPHVKLVVSCLSDRAKDDPAGQPFAELTRRQLLEKNSINLDALSEEDASTLLFEKWLPQAGRKVSDQQREGIEQILKSKECRQPIYLKLLFEEARLWRSYDAAPELGESVTAILDQFFKRLRRPENHHPVLVEHVLGYIAASRHGLAENEILEVLFADPDYKAALDQATVQTRHELPASATRIPIAIWSRLRFDLAPYLTERAAPGANVLTFYHRQVAEWVQEHFVKASEQSWQPHRRLADYFRILADPEENQSWKGASPRPFVEVAFHHTKAQQFDELCQTLCDLKFVEARCRLSQVFDLIADYQLAQQNLPEAQADLHNERANEEHVRRWTAEIIQYARQWSERRDQLERGQAPPESEPKLPESVPTCKIWSEERIKAECERIIKTPTRRDRLDAFADFVSGQCYPLLEHGKRPGFVIQHAFNTAPVGGMHEAAGSLLATLTEPHLLRRWPAEVGRNLMQALVRTLEGHSAAITSVSVTPDGRRALSGSHDKTLRVWDLERGACLRVLEGHSSTVSSVSVTPDGRRAVSGSWDKTLRVWDLESGACLRILEGHTEIIKSVSLTPDGRRAVSGGCDKVLRVWDVESCVCLHAFEGHTEIINSVSVTPDGRRAITGGSDATIRVWDLESGSCLSSIEGHRRQINSVTVVPDGYLAMSGSSDKTIRVWNLASRQCLCVLERESDIVRKLRDGYGSNIAGWSLQNASMHFNVISVSLTLDGKRALSGSEDGILELWDLDRGQSLRALQAHSGGISSTSMTPDGRRAVSGSHDRTLRVWDLQRAHSSLIAQSHTAAVSSISVTPDEQCVVAGDEHGTIRIWDIKSAKCLRSIERPPLTDDVMVMPDGRFAVSRCKDKMLSVWKLESQPWLSNPLCSDAWVRCVDITPDARRAVSGNAKGTLELWDLGSGQCVRTFKGHRRDISCVRVTPDGKCLVSGSEDGTLRIWNLESGRCIRTLEGHNSWVNCVCVASHGRHAVSGGADKMLRFWDLQNGKCLCVFEGHSDWIKAVVISNNGQWGISASLDNTVRIWDLENAQCLIVGSGVEPWLAVAHSTAHNCLISGARNGEVVVFDLAGLLSGPAICTASRGSEQSTSLFTHCSRCGREFTVSTLTAAAIFSHMARLEPGQSPCLDLPNSAFTDPRLLAACEHCSHSLRLNPFIVECGQTDNIEGGRRTQ